MKKLAIAGASAVLAALPVVGVFADDPIIDEIKVTVNSSCHMSTGATAATQTYDGARLSATVAPGTLVGDTGTSWGGTSSTIKVTCNDDGGWQVTAQGVAGLTGTAATTAQTVMKAQSHGVDIVTGLGTSNTPSNWAYKVTGAGQVSADFRVVPETATVVATSNSPVAEGSITPAYRVWVATDQGADTYTGYVKYVLTAPIPAQP
ncbi:hypothetical protein IIY24_01795 [Candidatus Saccharibacteria bacterium]|nr:hypothetical protein [Candidatus Saccharibacteria bacterium]